MNLHKGNNKENVKAKKNILITCDVKIGIII